MTDIRLDPAGFFVRLPLAPHQLVDRHTRTEDVIVLCHLGVPRLSAEDWRLTIDGLVERPLTLSLSDLRAMPASDVETIHQCAGSPLRPQTPTRRICNVMWTGVPLATLIERCRPQPQARFIWSHGADSGSFDGVEVGHYVKDLPIGRIAQDVLIAYALNGAPLPAEHGFPFRLVVPGFYGTNSVKWLRRISFETQRSPGPFTTRWYNDVVHDESGKPGTATSPVWTIAPEAVIVAPAPDAVVVAGAAVEVWGWAWSDDGIATVEISGDNGAVWNRAKLEPRQGRSWQRFSFTWTPTPGRHVLSARAQTAAGMTQPATGARNAIHSVEVTAA